MTQPYSVPPHWQEGTEATPEQFLDWLVKLRRDEQLEVIGHVKLMANKGAGCFMEDHQGRLEYLERAHRNLFVEHTALVEGLQRVYDKLKVPTSIEDVAMRSYQAATERAEAEAPSTP